MSDFHVDRSMSSASAVIVAVMMFAACAGQARGEVAPADGRQPLNQRVFRSCFGVNTHFWQGQPLEEIALVQDIGATWIRDEGNWSGEDADPASYDTSWLEKWVNEAHRRGLKVMVHLGLGTSNEELRRPDAYAKYAGLVASRLRGKIQAYHGPNEPYGPFLETFSPHVQQTLDMWTVEGESPWRLWIERHSELVRKAADAIHAADPDAIMLPEGVDVFRHPADVFFTHHRWMFEAGLGNHVNGVTVHPYTSMDVEGVGFVGAAPPEITAMKLPTDRTKDHLYVGDDGRVSLGAALQLLRDQAKQATGRDIDIWINEWGYGFGRDWAGGDAQLKGGYLVRMFMVGFANNARIVGWHNLRDMRDGPCGLVDNELNKRREYFAYKTMSKTIGDLYLQRVVHGSPRATRGVQAYLFGKDDHRVLAVWNIDNGERTVNVDGILPDAKIIDTFGETVAAEITDGAVSLTVNGKPRYVVGVAGQVSVTDRTQVVLVQSAPQPAAATELTAPVRVLAPERGHTVTVGRKTGRASITADDESLILDSMGLGFVGLNFYDDGDVSLAKGGGNVGAGTSTPSSAFEVSRDQDATTFLTINNSYPKRGKYQANAGTGIRFNGYRDYPAPTEAARIESKYISGHHDDVVIIGDLRFSTSATWGNIEERMRITYDGDVGIGTHSPAAKLEVSGSAKAHKYITAVTTIPADETTPDVSGAGVLVTSANTKATAITDLTNTTVGQTVRIIGGSDENPSTIADGGRFRLSGPWAASVDDVLILLVLREDRYVELGRADN